MVTSHNQQDIKEKRCKNKTCNALLCMEQNGKVLIEVRKIKLIIEPVNGMVKSICKCGTVNIFTIEQSEYRKRVEDVKHVLAA